MQCNISEICCLFQQPAAPILLRGGDFSYFSISVAVPQ